MTLSCRRMQFETLDCTQWHIWFHVLSGVWVPSVLSGWSAFVWNERNRLNESLNHELVLSLVCPSRGKVTPNLSNQLRFYVCIHMRLMFQFIYMEHEIEIGGKCMHIYWGSLSWNAWGDKKGVTRANKDAWILTEQIINMNVNVP